MSNKRQCGHKGNLSKVKVSYGEWKTLSGGLDDPFTTPRIGIIASTILIIILMVVFWWSQL